MNKEPDNEMPAEIDFSKGVRGIHHIPSDARVLMPASIERTVWEYFSGKAERRGLDLSELFDRSAEARHRNQRGIEVGLLMQPTV